MKKLNLKDVQEATAFNNPKPGGYICGITNVEDVPYDSKTGKGDYLKLEYDIVDGEFKGYYSKLKKEKDWKMPNFIKSYKDNCLPFFKGMVTAFEKSNKNFTWNNDETKLKGKYVGLVLCEEEYLNAKGEVKTRLVVDSVHSVEAIKKGDFKVPDKKVLTSTDTASKPANTNIFDEAPEEEKEEESVNFFDDDSDPF